MLCFFAQSIPCNSLSLFLPVSPLSGFLPSIETTERALLPMGEADGAVNRAGVGSSSSSSRAMESLSLEINRYPRDLLTRFMSSDGHGGQKRRALTREEEEEDEAEREAEEIELNLGLSLGGRFGVDKTSKKITRSSSIAGSIPFLQEPDAFSSPPAATSYPLLMRTSSLPTETEEEWRKRKEMQSLRRMEAKRRRSEKQRNSNTNPTLRGVVVVGGGGGGELSLLEEEKKELLGNVNSSNSNSTSRGNWMASWGSCRQGGMNLNRSSSSNHLQVGSQGSVESQGGNSSTSGMSEMESKPNLQGSGSGGGESRSPMSNQSLQDQRNLAGCSSVPKPTTEKSSKATAPEAETSQRSLAAASSGDKRGREVGTSAMEDMPCVFTIGDGPNGRRVEGILYKYGRGEEVRIMCVCHGSFLSPAEFVKHAGGINVDHPLRHIVVNPAGPSFC